MTDHDETTDEAPATTPATAPPLSDHEAKAIRHLARAIGGLTTTLRAVATGRELHAPFTLEPLGWTGDSLAEYDKLARASRERERRRGEKAGRDIDQTAAGEGDTLTREAVGRLSTVAETLTQALEVLAAGAPIGSVDTLRHVIMADGQLTDLVRLIPEDEYTGAIREVWGREAMPVRLR